MKKNICFFISVWQCALSVSKLFGNLSLTFIKSVFFKNEKNVCNNLFFRNYFVLEAHKRISWLRHYSDQRWAWFCQGNDHIKLIIKGIGYKHKNKRNEMLFGKASFRYSNICLSFFWNSNDFLFSHQYSAISILFANLHSYLFMYI